MKLSKAEGGILRLPILNYCCFLILILLSGWRERSFAQTTPTSTFSLPSDSALAVGNTVPEYFYQISHRAVTGKAGEPFLLSLNDARNKLIILDFWATWCGPCIASLEKLDSLQKVFGASELMVVPVTYHDAGAASAFLKKVKWDLPTIITDTILKKYFPHQGIPYQVWIKDGKVKAIPRAYYATAENIRKTIEGEETVIRNAMKKVDLNKPLFLDDNGSGEALLFQSVIGGGDPYYREQRPFFSSGNDSTSYGIYNVPLGLLFYTAFRQEIHQQLDYNTGVEYDLSPALLKEIRSPRPEIARYADVEDFQREYDRWIREHLYSYGLSARCEMPRQAVARIMREDLNRFFGQKLGIEGIAEKRPKKIAVLSRLKDKNPEELLRSAGGQTSTNLLDTSAFYYRFRNVTMGSFRTVVGLSKAVPEAVMMIDSTGISRDFDIDFRLSKKINGNLSQLRRELNRYGLDIRVEEKQLPLLVIRQNGF